MQRSAEQALRDFSANLTAQKFEVPAGVMGRNGAVSTRRFEVYRNNVLSSLCDALAANFPAIQQLLGAAYFRALGVEYVRHAPPTQPVLSEYGSDFPAFLRAFPPLQAYPYLGDVAALEWAWLRAYHGADQVCTALEDLRVVEPEVIPLVRFQVHPTAQIISSGYPVHDIFRKNRNIEGEGSRESGPQHVLVVRPQLHVTTHDIPQDKAFFFNCLASGAALGEAAEASLSQFKGFDLEQALAFLLQVGALARVASCPIEFNQRATGR